MDSLAGRLDRRLGILEEGQTNSHHVKLLFLQHVAIVLVHTRSAAARECRLYPRAVFVRFSLGVGSPLNVGELGDAAQQDVAVALTADQSYTNQSVGRDHVPRLCAASFSQGQACSHRRLQESAPVNCRLYPVGSGVGGIVFHGNSWKTSAS